VARAVHAGVEASVRASARPWLVLDATYAWSRFILDELGTFSGNRLPGIPPHAGTVRATFSGARGWDGYVALVAASGTFVSDANTESADAYGVLSAGAGHRIGRVRLFVRGENLGDVRYTNRVQVNDASGFYYYPAPGRSGQAGVEIRW
jgi:iron complex outermembrane receptor protein